MFFRIFLFITLAIQAQNAIDKFWGVDNFGNQYFSTENTINKSGEHNKQYTFNNYGMPDNVDITNPLKIIAYFKYYNKVIILDNQLNPIEEIDIPFSTSHICYGGNIKLWLFNAISTELELFNIKTKTIELKSLPLGYAIKELKSYFNKIAVLTTKNEISLYNYIGRKIHTTQHNFSIIDFDVTENDVYIQTANKLLKNNQLLLEKYHSKIWVNNKQIYLFDGKKITNFETP